MVVWCAGKYPNRGHSRKQQAYVNELEFCFGILPDGTTRKISYLCVGCRRAVQGYRRTGKRIHHVSNLETLLNIQCASFPVNLNSFCKNRLQ